jgi:hypothetical protein
MSESIVPRVTLPVNGFQEVPSFNSFFRQEHSDSPPAFPIEVLPGAAGRLVEEGAAALRVAPDLIAVPLLVSAGAAIGRTRQITLKPGYKQRPNLYGGVVADPGEGKSPARELAMHPLDVLQKEAAERWKQAPPEVALGGKSKAPTLEHYYTTDSTWEALGPMLEHSPGVVLVKDELVGWVKAYDAYRNGRGGDREHWLSAWSGAQLKIDRKTAPPIFVPEPVLCVVGGVQPDKLSQLAAEAGQHDGFIDRILWTYPIPGPGGWSDDVVSPRTFAGIVEQFRALRASGAAPVEVHLTAEAKALWVEWYNDNTWQQQQVHGLLRGVYAKAPNQLSRLGLIVHSLEDPRSTSLDTETMYAGIRLVEYFIAHARLVLPRFGPMAGPQLEGFLRRVAGALRRAGGEHDWVDRTEIQRGLGNSVPTDQLTWALRELEQLGLGTERRWHPGGPGRPAEQWTLLPKE